MTSLFVALIGLASGCRVITLGVVTVATAVGLAGYVVYKTGDAAVTGAGKAAVAAGDVVSSGSKSAATVIFANGEFKTVYAQDLRTVWAATGFAFRKAKFRDLQGTFDALSGGMTARTQDGKEISLKLKSLGAQATEARIRAGFKGDLEIAELVHGLILRELPPAPAPPAAPMVNEEVNS